MKKNLLFALACAILFSFTASSQITKGSVLLGGGISGGKGTSESNNRETITTSFGINPAVGLAVQNNTVIGLRLSYGKNKSEIEDGTAENWQRTNQFGAGFFYRRYMNLSQKFYLFGEGSVFYNGTKQETRSSWQQMDQKIKSVGINFYPGVAYAVSRKMHLEIGLNNLLDISYSHSKTASPSGSEQTSSGFGFYTNVSTSAPLTVGFRFVLGK
ncbi:outer membrane beta-barrel protein [Flavisolibacter sp. BT320]|nr:outer membrane beta-barrel protein [Flavisolibacter longurius]